MPDFASVKSMSKIRHLAALALGEGASEEESRTAAVLALRLIREEGLLDRGGRSQHEVSEDNPDWSFEIRSFFGTELPKVERGFGYLVRLSEVVADRFVCFLEDLARSGVYMFIPAHRIAQEVVSRGHIAEGERGSFTKTLTNSLRRRVQEGELISRKGHGGGFGLRPRGV